MNSESSARSTVDEHRTIAEISELAGGLAHELRNPLSTMMINLRLLAEDLQDATVHPDDARRRALVKVNVLQREAERLQSLFDDFLRLTGPCSLQREEVDLNGVIARLVGFFEPQARAQGVEVCVAGTTDPLLCPTDERLLRQALLNIVINAQEAMPGGGVLRISLERDGTWAVIAVSDTGVGVAAEDRQRILRPFFSTKATGTGLGLSITQRIINEHGGTMSFDGEVGKGTTVVVRLPLRAGDVKVAPQAG